MDAPEQVYREYYERYGDDHGNAGQLATRIAGIEESVYGRSDDPPPDRNFLQRLVNDGPADNSAQAMRQRRIDHIESQFGPTNTDRAASSAVQSVSDEGGLGAAFVQGAGRGATLSARMLARGDADYDNQTNPNILYALERLTDANADKGVGHMLAGGLGEAVGGFADPAQLLLAGGAGAGLGAAAKAGGALARPVVRGAAAGAVEGGLTSAAEFGTTPGQYGMPDRLKMAAQGGAIGAGFGAAAGGGLTALGRTVTRAPGGTWGKDAAPLTAADRAAMDDLNIDMRQPMRRLPRTAPETPDDAPVPYTEWRPGRLLSDSSTPAQKATAREVDDLVRAGLPEGEAVKLLPEGDRVPGASGDQGDLFDFKLYSGIDPALLLRFVSDSIQAGRWAAGHAYAAARWLGQTAGPGLRKMQEAASALLGKFGRPIRSHVKSIWDRYNEIRGRQRVSRSSDPDSPLNQPREFDSRTRMDRLRESFGDRGRSAIATFNKASYPMSDRISEISPRLYGRLYQYSADALRMKHKTRTLLDGDMKTVSRGLKSLGGDAKARMNAALLNGRFEDAMGIGREVGGPFESALRRFLGNSRGELNRYYQAAQRAGMEVGYLDDFWPRRIKRGAMGKLRQGLSGEERSALDDALRLEADRNYGGRIDEMPQEARDKVVSEFLAQRGNRPHDATRPREFKERRVVEIPDEFLHFYEDFDTSLDAYVESVSEKIARRRLFGSTRQGGDPDLASSIGAILDREQVPVRHHAEVQDMLESLFRHGDKPLGSVTGVMRDVGYIATMGNFMSTITQFGDIPMVALQQGLPETLTGMYRAATGRSQVTLRDLGLDRIAEELTGRTATGKLLDRVFYLTGLKGLDQKIKSGAIEASLIRAQKELSKDAHGSRLSRRIRAEFGDDADQLIQDLRDHNPSEMVHVFALSRLGDFQPVTKLEVPSMYHSARAMSSQHLPGGLDGLPVLAYQLKTFSLRRMGAIRRTAFGDLSNGIKNRDPKQFARGVRVIVGMGLVLAGADGSIDLFKDWIMGRDLDPATSYSNASLQLVGMNRYNTAMFKRGGAAGVGSMILPPAAGIAGDLAADVNKWAQGKTSNRVARYTPFRRGTERLQEAAGLRESEPDDTPAQRPLQPSRPQRPERP
ncbi:MAG: hypothetical protein AAGI37_18180 [Planctomycetota bacterium]